MSSYHFINILLYQAFSRLSHTKWNKYANLLRRSITTHTILLPLGLHGNTMIKSTVIFSHIHSSIDNGWSNPHALWCSAFTCWHSWHLHTNLAISCFIPYHQKYYFKYWYIIIPLGWIDMSLWKCCWTFLLETQSDAES